MNDDLYQEMNSVFTPLKQSAWVDVLTKTFNELEQKCLAACPAGCLAVLPWTEKAI